jgi:succinyl-diaminopimelate desuccinylase
VDKIIGAPEVGYAQDIYDPPIWNAPDTEMVEIVRGNARTLAGIDPRPVVSLVGTDARLWRYKDVPQPSTEPTGMGGVDEHVTVEEFLHLVRCHVLSTFDYMSCGASAMGVGSFP